MLGTNEFTVVNLEQVLEVAEALFGDSSNLDRDAVKDTQKNDST